MSPRPAAESPCSRGGHAALSGQQALGPSSPGATMHRPLTSSGAGRLAAMRPQSQLQQRSGGDGASFLSLNLSPRYGGTSPGSNFRSPAPSPRQSPTAEHMAQNFSNRFVEADISEVDPRHLLQYLNTRRVPRHDTKFNSTIRRRRAGAVCDGFQDLAKSLRRLLPQLQGQGGLSYKWRELAQWIDKFHVDRDVEKLAERCELLLEQVYSMQAGRAVKHPNPVVTKTVLVLFEQLIGVIEQALPRLRDVAVAVRAEVLDAILVSGGPEEPVLPNLLDAADSAEVRRLATQAETELSGKPYYALVREIAQRVGKAEEDIMREEFIREKQMAVMDRGMNFWQMETQKLILKAWRVIRNWEQRLKEKEVELKGERMRVEKLQVELRHARIQALRDQDELKEKVEQLTAQVALRDKDLGTVLKERDLVRTERDEALTIIQDQNKTIEAKNDQIRVLSTEAAAMDQLLEDTLRDDLQGPAWEVQRQEEHASFFEDPLAMSQATALAAWYNAVLSAASAAGQYDVRISGFELIPSVLDAHIIVMHHMSPHAVVGSLVDGCLITETPRGKAEQVIKAAQSLELGLVLIPNNLLRPPLHALHNMRLAAALFERFADSGLANARELTPLSAGADIRVEHMLSPQAGNRGRRAPRPASHWKFRIASTIRRLWRLRAAAASAQLLVIETALGQLNGKLELRSLGEAALVEHDRVCVQPWDDSSDSFASVSKYFSGSTQERYDERVQIASVVDANYYTICRLHEQYCLGRLSALESALRLSNDAKLPPRTFSKEKVGECLSDLGIAHDASSMGYTEFEHLLLRLAEERNRLSKDGRSPGERLNMLLQRHIIAHARWSSPNELRLRVFQQDVQEVLGVHNTLCARIFVYFIERDKKAKVKDAMRLDIFCDLAQEAGIVDSSLTKDVVRETVYMMHGVPDDEAVTLDYFQFLEALCVLAMWKTPAPFVPLSAKVGRLFELYFVPQLSVRITGLIQDKARPDVMRQMLLRSQVSALIAGVSSAA
eukprot:TRINITY_DN65845_c0_g1_i1.p1 TRINITY_DN65845_c0_g1~~TRINITY_DN65845_c0_g1_i1.p1  ORF type:complete len:1160 (+),score=285.29 TRINITY_DN65845_c0_g1_i1:455-3481(+)